MIGLKVSFETNSFIISWLVCFISYLQVMRSIFAWGCLVAVLFRPGLSDIYLHCPPGSNNRLNGEGTNVGNNKRLFDSQVELHLYTILYINVFVPCEGIRI